MNKLPACLLCLATLCCATLAHACERRDPEPNGDDRTRHVRLSGAMDDGAILRALRLQPDRAEVVRSSGRSGASTRYAYFQRSVTIVRSAGGAVQVEMLEQGREPLLWKLEAC